MKRIFFFISLCLLIIGTVVSCATKKPLNPVIITNTKVITKVIKDTVFQVEADSSYYEAYIKCVNGKPVLNDTPETKANSRSGKTLNQPTAKIDGNKLKVDCFKNLQELHKQWEETYIKEHEQKPIYIDKPVEVEKPLTFWQKTQVWLGRIFLLFISLCVLAFILRWKKVI